MTDTIPVPEVNFFRAIKNREGAFSIYDPEEVLELVGYTTCGGCPEPTPFLKSTMICIKNLVLGIRRMGRISSTNHE